MRRRAAALTLACALGAAAAGLAQPIPPIPAAALARWQANMRESALPVCAKLRSGSAGLADTYYDAVRVFAQIAAYTKDPATWRPCVDAAVTVYRTYVMTSPQGPGGVPGYWNFTTGLRMEGSAASVAAVIALSRRAAYTPDTVPLAWTESSNRSREVAYAIVSYIDAEAVGQPRRARRRQLVDQAYGHMDQWFGKFCWKSPIPSGCPNGSGDQFSPFMVGLTANALIMDWQGTHDARLLPALQKAADWLWAHGYVTGKSGRTGRECAAPCGFFYDAANGGTGPGTGAPDLNLLIAPMYAFLCQQTKAFSYCVAADRIFADGVNEAYLGDGKHVDQQYMLSFDYVTWRNAAASP